MTSRLSLLPVCLKYFHYFLCQIKVYDLETGSPSKCQSFYCVKWHVNANKCSCNFIALSLACVGTI